MDKIKFKESKSKASCKITDITKFMYGAFSSRFWMLRKHINSFGRDSFENFPFYCWQCITLEVHKRDVDLVIQNEEHQSQFLLFLIHSLNTINGKRGTAERLIQSAKKDELDETRFEIYQKVYFKYLILKIRMKISFQALKKSMTIKELLLKAVLKAY